MEPKKQFMEIAIEEALRARKEGDYAIGAVVVLDDKIITRAMNRVIVDKDPTKHAEMIAIRRTARNLDRRHLTGCILYTTNEPCPMCAGAVLFSKMTGVVSGATMEDMREYALAHANPNYTWRTVDTPAKDIFERGDPGLIYVPEFMREECRKLFHS